MPLMITQRRYTSDAVRGLIAKPEARNDDLNKLVAAVGGKLLALDYTFGDYDFLMLTKGPNEDDPAAAVPIDRKESCALAAQRRSLRARFGAPRMTLMGGSTLALACERLVGFLAVRYLLSASARGRASGRAS